MSKTIESAKSLILLGRADCSESGQRRRNQDTTSVWGDLRFVAHKVFHRHGGENQNHPRIKNLGHKPEYRLNCGQRFGLPAIDDA